MRYANYGRKSQSQVKKKKKNCEKGSRKHHSTTKHSSEITMQNALQIILNQRILIKIAKEANGRVFVLHAMKEESFANYNVEIAAQEWLYRKKSAKPIFNYVFFPHIFIQCFAYLNVVHSLLPSLSACPFPNGENINGKIHRMNKPDSKLNFGKKTDEPELWICVYKLCM